MQYASKKEVNTHTLLQKHTNTVSLIQQSNIISITAMNAYQLQWHVWYCKTRFFACPLFHEFREPGKFAKITGRENLNTVAFQCGRKQKH